MCQYVSIVSDNDLSPVRHQAITGTNDELLSMAPLGTNFGDFLSKSSIQGNAFENVVCKVVAISSGPQNFSVSRNNNI